MKTPYDVILKPVITEKSMDDAKESTHSRLQLMLTRLK